MKKLTLNYLLLSGADANTIYIECDGDSIAHVSSISIIKCMIVRSDEDCDSL